MTAILAMAAGNAVILKPPTQTPFVALRFGALALEAGIHAGVLNIVPGDAEAGEALIAHPAVGKISFTGGDAVARSEEHTSELQSLMRISYAAVCLKKKRNTSSVHYMQYSISSHK